MQASASRTPPPLERQPIQPGRPLRKPPRGLEGAAGEHRSPEEAEAAPATEHPPPAPPPGEPVPPQPGHLGRIHPQLLPQHRLRRPQQRRRQRVRGPSSSPGRPPPRPRRHARQHHPQPACLDLRVREHRRAKSLIGPHYIHRLQHRHPARRPGPAPRSSPGANALQRPPEPSNPRRIGPQTADPPPIPQGRRRGRWNTCPSFPTAKIIAPSRVGNPRHHAPRKRIPHPHRRHPGRQVALRLGRLAATADVQQRHRRRPLPPPPLPRRASAASTAVRRTSPVSISRAPPPPSARPRLPRPRPPTLPAHPQPKIIPRPRRIRPRGWPNARPSMSWDLPPASSRTRSLSTGSAPPVGLQHRRPRSLNLDLHAAARSAIDRDTPLFWFAHRK